MTTGVLTLVDPEKTARDWARADPGISAAVGTKVFFSQPIAFAKAAMMAGTPYIIVTLVSETFQSGDLGMQQPLIQWNCYGSTKAAAAVVALAVQTSVRLLTFGKPTAVGTSVIAWADAAQARWLPDPTINAPRYVLDCRFAIYGPQT
jgi:hypothetical protein